MPDPAGAAYAAGIGWLSECVGESTETAGRMSKTVASDSSGAESAAGAAGASRAAGATGVVRAWHSTRAARQARLAQRIAVRDSSAVGAKEVAGSTGAA